MKIGFIGFGKSANRYHMPFIDLLKDEFKMIGYYDNGNTKFKMEYPTPAGFKSYDSLEELYESVDIVVINTPSKYHFEYTKQALLAGKNVICEKPITNNLQQLNELFEIANEKKLFLTPYQNRRFDSDFVAIINALKSEDIGKLIEIESIHSQFRIDNIYSNGNKYDGAVMGHAVHFVDQIVSVFGEPDDVKYDIVNQANEFLFESKNQNLEDYYDIKLIYGKMRIRLKFSRMTAKEQPRWVVNGTKGTIEKFGIDQQERDLKLGKFPIFTKNFGFESPNTDVKIYKVLSATEDQPIVEMKKIKAPIIGYEKFYKNVYEHILHNSERLVKEKEAKIVINILTTIVEQKKYEKII